jgi:integrase
MSGHVGKYRTKAGTQLWRYTVELPPDEHGRRRQRTRRGFRRKVDADRAMRAELHGVEQGTAVDRSTVTVAAYLREWVEGIRVRPTTKANYETCITVHLIPTTAKDGRSRPGIGGVQLQALRAEHLDRLYRYLEVEGKHTKDGPKPLAIKSIRHVHTTIRKALQDAVARGYVSRNVADLAHPPTQSQARSRMAVDAVWTTDQLRQFLAASAGDPMHALFHLACTTGMRRAELLGLRWADVDLDIPELRVRWTITEARGKVVEQDGAKTRAGERVIALDQATARALREHRAAQHQHRLLLGPAWADEVGRVFTNPIGRILVPGTILDRLHRIAAEAGLPRIGVHGLRHSYATAALRAGVDIDVVSKRLGHADVAITLNVYSHVRRSDDRAAAERAAAAILG